MTSQNHALNPNNIGYIIGTSGTDTFQFVSTTGLMPGRLEYCVLRNFPDQRAGKPHRVDVLAQVTSIGVDSRLLQEDLSFDETVAILTGRFTDRPRVILDARIIGYRDERGNVRRPRFAAAPGHPVERADDVLLRQFFCVDINAGIQAGTLIDRPGVEVLLDPNGLRRHLAIIAQTGAGKSYLAGRIIESLITLGANFLILDPNSDYCQLRKVAGDAERPYVTARRTPFADRIDLYRIPGLAHYRYNADMVGPSQPYTVRFADLLVYDILELAGVDEKFVRISAAVRVAVDSLKARRVAYTPKDLVAELRRRSRPEPHATPAAEAAVVVRAGDSGEHASDYEAGPQSDTAVRPQTAVNGQNAAPLPDDSDLDDDKDTGPKPADFDRAVNYIEPLCSYSIWGEHSISIDRCLEPQRATVLDLAGGGRKVVEYTAAYTLTKIWERALAGQLPHPIFIVLEEAHNLAPGHGGRTRASAIINTIAAEGRKFHVFLIVITQRPSKINEDVLSQCGAQIIMRVTNGRDQQAIANAVEAASSELVSDLAGLNRGEAVVLGQLTRIPAILTVGERLSAEGGADIDLVEALGRALATAGVRREAQAAHANEPMRPARAREVDE